MKRIVGYALVSLSVVLGGVWVAAQVDLTTFDAGNLIRADEVNANFSALKAATEDLQAAVATLEAAQPKTYTLSVMAADWDSGLHYGDGNVFRSFDIPPSAVGGTDLGAFHNNGGTVLVYAQPRPGTGYNEDKAVPHLYELDTGTGSIGLKIEYIPRRARLVISQTTNGWDANNVATGNLPDQVDFRVVLIDSVSAP